jgi:hypothetical protein
VGKHCSVCDEVLLAQKPITATGHTAVVDPAREATCTETGLTEGSHCSVCAEVLVAQESPPLGEHSYVDGQCTACGKDQQSEGLAYALNGDQKSYTVAGIGTCEDTKLYIPAAYQGLPVTAIKASAFVNCKVTSVVVPDSVTSIGTGAFYGCNSLVEITLPFIGSSENTNFPLGYIFGSTSGEGTSKTSENKGYTYQAVSNGYNNCCYYIPESLRKVIITKDTHVQAHSFYNCDLIEIVVLSENVSRLGSYAFMNCTGITNIYTETSRESWNKITHNSYWNANTDFYVHTNVERYGLYFDLPVIELTVRGQHVALCPENSILDLKVYDTVTGEILSLSEAGLQTGTPRSVSAQNDQLVTSSGGLSILRILDKLGALCEDPFWMLVTQAVSPNMTVSQDNRDYITLCLDVYLNMYDINDMEAIIDIEMSYMENVLYNIDNLGDYIAGFLEGDLTETTILKKAFGDFIQDYVDNNYAHYKAVDDTKAILAGMKAVHELYEDHEDWLDVLPHEILKLVREIHDMYELAEAGKLYAGQVHELAEKLLEIIELNGMSDKLCQMQAWREYAAETRRSYDYYTDALKRVKKATRNSSVYQQLTDGKFCKVFSDNKPGALETGMMVLDSVIYILSDYTNNVEVLEKIREGMLANGYSHKDIEVHIIDELILEYQGKWIECVSNFETQFIGETIVNIATKHPILTIVKVAASLTVELSAIDEKAEWIALSGYRDAFRACMQPVYDVYYSGQINGDIRETKQFVSLYLSIIWKSNELAVDIAIRESSDENVTDDLYALNHNISVIKELAKMCK